MKWFLLGSDERMVYLQQFLSARFSVLYYPVNGWTNEVNRKIEAFHPTHIMLPISPMDICTDSFSLTGVEQLWMGRESPELSQIAQEYSIPVVRYLEEEEWIWCNANVTSESFLKYFYEEQSEQIEGQSFVVTGFGRVAKCLANLLVKMRAKIVIYARSPYQIAEAKAFGYETISSLEKTDLVNAYLVNTIPSKWITSEISNNLHGVKKIFDLASAPGCVDSNVKVKDEDYVLLAGLPGKMLPVSAGKILFDQIMRYQLAGGEVVHDG
ncbi:NAD(P)-dependent oxidoreductase [Paenisporosarcina cavernae]|uniref:Dipicolinate synthase subunit A n=1 Tax=Paenisporosarcina cavernae TaxID=2320858 RepID=A0A385YUD1_9BACL|nr:hypothetical protein [Paenisporosarcina cavernae]AYC29288.1 hypothetical protein D3873_05110 [Paenisporosarcina cavernae]